MIDVITASWNRERAEKLMAQMQKAEASRNRYHITGDRGQPMLPVMASAVKGLPEDWAIACHVHDDLELVETPNRFWDVATISAFDDPKIGLVGWGGATGLGHKDLYKVQYKIENLARENYASAVSDWKEHGSYLDRPREVAVLDGFAMAFRREAYEEMGGWQKLIDMGTIFHAYDTISCLLLHRLGWKIMAVPVSCQHLGGRTSTTPEYQELLRSLGYQDDLEVHQKIHRMLHDEFRDCLPVRV
jgi:hypothetical protein